MNKKKNNTEYLWFFSVIAFSAIGAFFMVNVEMPTWAFIVSGFSIVLFAAPSFWAIKMWLGWRDAAIVICILGVYALSIESLAVKTGFPYGSFAYSEILGFKLFGIVPWSVTFAWTPLILASYAVSNHVFRGLYNRILSTAVLLILFDLVIDPGAVFLGFWKYSEGGAFYNVPFGNFVGWLFSGIIGAIILEVLIKRFKPLLPTPVQLTISGLFIVIFWSMISLFAGMIVPFMTGTALTVFLALFYKKYHFAFDEMIVLVDETNTPLATAPKLATHNLATPLHRAFSVFLFNRRGELLMQQRAFTKKTWAGTWSNSCCGHLMLHESLEDAAARRLNYELGLKRVKLVNILPDFRYRAEKDGIVEHELCPVLVGVTEKIPQPNPNEVADFSWLPWEDFKADTTSPNCKFSPWSILESRQLVGDKVFQQWYENNIES